MTDTFTVKEFTVKPGGMARAETAPDHIAILSSALNWLLSHYDGVVLGEPVQDGVAERIERILGCYPATVAGNLAFRTSFAVDLDGQ